MSNKAEIELFIRANIAVFIKLSLPQRLRMITKKFYFFTIFAVSFIEYE